jgi:RNA-directed DNA polymerase
METLREAYRLARKNNGKPGADGVTFKRIEREGKEDFLRGIREELVKEEYYPLRYRQVEIPKANRKVRRLRIPSIRDRVVQAALKLILDPIFEADFQDSSYAYRPGRNAHQMIGRVSKKIVTGQRKVLDVDLKTYFDDIRHHKLLEMLARRIDDARIMRLVKLIVKTNGKKGVPQGGVLSPLLANIYLNKIDEMFKKAAGTAERNGYGKMDYCRFADDIVITASSHSRSDRLLEYSRQRLEEELRRLGVELNPEKTKIVDLEKGETFNLLGFTWRLATSRKGKKFPLIIPRSEKRAVVLGRVKEVIRENWNEKLPVVIGKINPVIRGWVNYFRIGHSSKTFSYVRWDVEKKVRRFIRKKQKRPGYGSRKWSTEVPYKDWGLFNDYQVRYYRKATCS